MQRAALASLFSLSMLFTSAHAQRDTTARLTGTVRSSINGLPVSGVMIAVKGSRVFIVSDSTGSFTLVGLPEGRQTVRILYGDSLSYEHKIDLKQGKTLTLSVLVVVAEMELTPIVVVAQNLRARRRISGRGGVQGPGRSAPGILVGVATQLRCRGDVEPALDVEAEQQNVAVLHQVVPPLAPHHSLFPRSLVRPHAREIGERHGLGADEAALEIRMDFARRVERRAAAVHGPGAHLVFAHGEERLQAEQPVARVNQAVEARLADAGAREILGPFVP